MARHIDLYLLRNVSDFHLAWEPNYFLTVILSGVLYEKHKDRNYTQTRKILTNTNVKIPIQHGTYFPFLTNENSIQVLFYVPP